jgi:hypothetical protein
VDTVSKVGLVLAAGGFSVWAAEGASWVVWLLLLAGLVLAFGPDLVAILRPRWQRRQELSAGVPGWEADIENIEHLGLLLMLTPPPDEEIDPTIDCEVRLPDGHTTSPRHTPPRRPGTAGADGKWNEWYAIRFPDDFDGVYSGALSSGEYWATWSRSHGLGRQVLRRTTFHIDQYGNFSMT